MDLATFDLALRCAGVAVLLLMALLLLRDALRQLAGSLLALFCIATVGYLLVSAPGATALPLWLHWPAMILAQANPVLFYLAARAMFDDGFALAPRHGLLLLGMIVLGVFCLAPPEWGSPETVAWGLNLRRVLTIALVAAAIWDALRGRADDLLAGRLRFRFAFALAVGGFSIVLAALELIWFGAGMPLVAATVNAAAVLMLATGFFLALFSLSPQGALAPIAPPKAAAPDAGAAQGEAAADRPVIAALEAAMQRDRLYRDEGLTIGSLANRLGVPEYRLRQGINQQLGFRNFNAYINALRLAEVKTALLDPAQREVSITTIALDAGFASIGPFNRAFKAATGTVPSEFRRQALAES